MKQLIFVIALTSICAITSFAQSKTDDVAIHNQKYYFPVSLVNDSVAMTKEIPSLGEKVLTDLTEKEKKILEIV